jgi:ketosteroid isomerase-like protein
MAWIAVGVAGVSAGMQAFSGYQQYKGQKAMADYNAKVAENEAIALEQATKANLATMFMDQRMTKAAQRMSVSGRGGTSSGTDLMSLAYEAQKMQLDNLEVLRQRDVGIMTAKSNAAMSKYQGKQAKVKGRWTVGTALMKGVGTAASLGALSGGGGGGKVPDYSNPAYMSPVPRN